MKTYWSEKLQKFVTIPGADIPPLDAAKKVFTLKLVDEFKDFVSDSMDEGMHNDFSDHMSFLAACMNTFIEMKNAEE